MIYRFRVILDNDTEDDIFRDIEIRKSDTLEDLHNTLTQSFGFDGTEMASFYKSDDEWNQGDEISLFDLSEGTNTVVLMSETLLEDMVDKANTKLIYVYDFFNLWTFLVELAEIVEESEGTDYPNLMFVKGQIPNEAPEISFKIDDAENFDEFETDSEGNDYESLDFDENWN
jgi:hypothetical protein